MKIPTSHLIGPALNFAVQTSLNLDFYHPEIGSSEPEFSTDPGVGELIIERFGINTLKYDDGSFFVAFIGNMSPVDGFDRCIKSFGSTRLEAAMRARVLSSLGAEVEIPDDIIEQMTVSLKVECLSGKLLDYAVLSTNPDWSQDDLLVMLFDEADPCSPSTNPAQAHPYMEDYKIEIRYDRFQDRVEATSTVATRLSTYGPNRLVAGMRCAAMTGGGAVVEIPYSLIAQVDVSGLQILSFQEVSSRSGLSTNRPRG